MAVAVVLAVWVSKGGRDAAANEKRGCNGGGHQMAHNGLGVHVAPPTFAAAVGARSTGLARLGRDARGRLCRRGPGLGRASIGGLQCVVRLLAVASAAATISATQHVSAFGMLRGGGKGWEKGDREG